MSNIEKIRQKIEWLRREIDDHNYYLDNSEQALGYSAALDEIEKFLDTLSEEPDKSLEEAAEEYAEKHGFRVPYDGSENFYDDVDVKASKEGFIAGAEWQKEQDTIEMVMSDGSYFQKCYALGKKDMKEQMMREGLDAVKSCQFDKIDKTIAGVFVKYGMDMQKQDMMKDAVEGEVVQDLKGRFHIKTNAVSDILYHFGDRVKVLILPEKCQNS